MADANEQLQEKIAEALEMVIDPELGIDIINLGLVYGVEVNEEQVAKVTMTLTAMGCPLAGTIEMDVKRALSTVEEISDADVSIVWNPHGRWIKCLVTPKLHWDCRIDSRIKKRA